MFAKALIRSEGLGRDAATDFLGLSFSAADNVGHDWGPNSPELLDVILRLDRTLGDLLAFVDEEIGREHVVVAVTSDHGVNPLPTYLQRRANRCTLILHSPVWRLHKSGCVRGCRPQNCWMKKI